MAESSRTQHAARADDPFADLRATAEQRVALLSGARPFDVEEWLRGAVPPSQEELDDLEDFLREREAERQMSLDREAQVKTR